MDTLILGYYEKENKIKKIIQISKENNTIQKINNNNNGNDNKNYEYKFEIIFNFTEQKIYVYLSYIIISLSSK